MAKSAVSGECVDELAPMMRVAMVLNRLLPRGKGAVPRKIGRWIGSGGPRSVIHTRQGAFLAVEPSSLDVYATMVNNGRTWNWHVLSACAAVLRPCETFYDIGANVGFMSMELSQAFLPVGVPRVIAFEPLPQLASAIRASAEMNNFPIQVRSEIVGDREGTAELFLGSHAIHASTRARETGSQVLSLPAVRIDVLVASGQIQPPSVIKIDVEGAELDAFKGAAETLRRHAPHIVFESDVNTARFSYSRKDLLDFLRSVAPYRFYEVTQGTPTTIIPLADEVDAVAHPADILATTLPEAEVLPINGRLAAWSKDRWIDPTP